MKKLFKFGLALCIIICIYSCGKDTYFNCFLHLTNNTEHNIYIEKTIDGNSVNLTTVDANEVNKDFLGEIDRHRGKDYPPETFIIEKLQNIRIYRKINDTIYELPRHYYDNPNDFTLYTDFFMGIYEMYYGLNVTEEMFQ